MSTTEPKKPRKPRANRRNFQAERQNVVQYCRHSIEILSTWDTKEFSDFSKGRLEGKVTAYHEILKQFGETE